ncbi:MAG: amino acid permease [Acidobacteriaceae bacterium]|nr:amino acid permease [Acidobacteriaceae bacterium]MBV8569691.1 amino acid permease [Acidobacteriaceae bacterium]
MKQLLQTKGIDELVEEAHAEGKQLKRSLGPWSLIAFGIGAVIGGGIFTVTGTAAAGQHMSVPSVMNAPLLDLLLHGSSATSMAGRPGAGPGLTLSFLLVALTCGFAALCYAELASMIPIAGSAYTYAYTTLGEIFAWIIGWDLILEYAVSNMSVAVGFSAYFNVMCDYLFGVHLPKFLSEPAIIEGRLTGSLFNIPSFLIVMLLSWILVRGVRESAGANNIMVVIKLAAVLLFVFGAAHAVQASNLNPFLPNGYRGVVSGAAIVFFTFIGFDSVSTAAEECKRPQRNMPIGIIGTLVVCGLLYTSVAFVLTGIVNWKTLDNASPVANALAVIGMNRLRFTVTVGALLGMLSSLLVYQYGQARIWFAMSRDRLLPDVFSKVHRTYQTPHVSTWLAGLAVGIPAGIWDIGTFADLSNIGTLFAFIIVSCGVVILRRKQPDRQRAFRVPLSPITPAISVVCCVGLMLGLPLETWIRFVVWLGIGLVIYGAYSRKRSPLYVALPAIPASRTSSTH